MKITAHIGFSDETDVLGRCIDHLYRIGVDAIVIGDISGEEAAMAPILKRYGGRADFALVTVTTAAKDPETLPAAMLRYSQAHFDSDWMLFTDADEFWIPRSGDIKQTAALAQADIISVNRFNLALEQGVNGTPIACDLEHPLGMLLYVNTPANSLDLFQTQPNHRWISGQVGPKVLARANAIEALSIGMHDVIPPPNASVRRAKADDLLIAHLPFTTFARFSNKVQKIHTIYQTDPARWDALPNTAWHWHRWRMLDNQGQLEAEFLNQACTREELLRLQAENVILTPVQYFQHPQANSGATPTI